MKAFLIVEGGDPKTADWFYAKTSWEALDAAKAAGYSESVGFAVVKTMNPEQMSFEAE